MGQAERIIELLGGSIDLEDGLQKSEIQIFWERLEQINCKTWVRKQIEEHLQSHHSNRFSSSRSSSRSFLQGSIYGYIVGKSGDVRFAAEAGVIALKLADKHHVHTK